MRTTSCTRAAFLPYSKSFVNSFLCYTSLVCYANVANLFICYINLKYIGVNYVLLKPGVNTPTLKKHQVVRGLKKFENHWVRAMLHAKSPECGKNCSLANRDCQSQNTIKEARADTPQQAKNTYAECAANQIPVSSQLISQHQPKITSSQQPEKKTTNRGKHNCRGFLWCRNPMLRFRVFPSVDVACAECCRCMQRCWFPQTLPTRQFSRCMSTVLTPD